MAIALGCPIDVVEHLVDPVVMILCTVRAWRLRKLALRIERNT